jgi:hypothetical protein
MQKLSYLDLATKVLRLFVPTTEVSDSDLHGILETAYSGFDPVLRPPHRFVPAANSVFLQPRNAVLDASRTTWLR